MMSKTRIILADDHAIVREGLKALINAEPDMEIIGDAADGHAVFEMASELKPDVVLMDISMPGLTGAQATRLLKHSCPHIKVLALTVHEDIGYIHQLIEAGASGYVCKRAAPDELIQAIRATSGTGFFMDPILTRKMLDSLEQKSVSADGLNGNQLSRMETKVVQLVAQGYSNREISALLEISIKTVETYKMRSMDKLGAVSRSDLFRYARQRGWLDEDAN